MDFQSNTERRVGLLAKLGATLPDGYHEVVGEAEAVRRVLAHNPMAHHDFGRHLAAVGPPG